MMITTRPQDNYCNILTVPARIFCQTSHWTYWSLCYGSLDRIIMLHIAGNELILLSRICLLVLAICATIKKMEEMNFLLPSKACWISGFNGTVRFQGLKKIKRLIFVNQKFSNSYSWLRFFDA